MGDTNTKVPCEYTLKTDMLMRNREQFRSMLEQLQAEVEQPANDQQHFETATNLIQKIAKSLHEEWRLKTILRQLNPQQHVVEFFAPTPEELEMFQLLQKKVELTREIKENKREREEENRKIERLKLELKLINQKKASFYQLNPYRNLALFGAAIAICPLLLIFAVDMGLLKTPVLAQTPHLKNALARIYLSLSSSELIIPLLLGTTFVLELSAGALVLGQIYIYHSTIKAIEKVEADSKLIDRS